MKQEKKKTKVQKIKKIVKPNIKHKYIKLAIFIAILVGIIVGISLLIRTIYINIYYAEYKEKMEWYSFNYLYDNEKANSTEKVYKEEVAKLTLGVTLNKTNLNYAVGRIKDIYDESLNVNEAWVKLAKYYDIHGIEETEFETRATKVDASIYLVQAIENILKKEIEITDTVKEKWVKEYSENEIELINKAVSIGLLKNSSSDIKDKTLIKGELNQMLIYVLEKYNTVYYKSIYDLNLENVNLVTEEENLPKNSEIYPYVLDNASKTVYEIESDRMNTTISKNPLQVYNTYKDEYLSTESDIEKYFDIILNVDYRTINKEKFIDSINEYVVYNLYATANDEYLFKGDVEAYVDYVIANKIVLKGEATTLLPIIYSDGLTHYLRTKITLNVVSSNTKENLILWDENTTYNTDNIEVYVDVPVSPTYYSKAFRVLNAYSLMDYIVINDGNVEVK